MKIGQPWSPLLPHIVWNGFNKEVVSQYLKLIIGSKLIDFECSCFLKIHVACMGEMTGVYKSLVEKPESRRPVGRPGSRWEDGIRIDLGKMG
jgi:hypothetical protein